MSGDFRFQFVVKYYPLNFVINFSDISTIPSPDEAFTKFVDELSHAFYVIKQLRKMYDETTSIATKQEVFELLHNAVTVTVDFYGSIQIYLRKHAEDQEPHEIILDGIEFEELWGPFVYELRAPTSALKGYIDLVYQASLSKQYEKQRVEYLAQFDSTLETELAILTAYKKHLAGDFDLHQYQTDEFFALLDRIKLENNQDSS